MEKQKQNANTARALLCWNTATVLKHWVSSVNRQIL